jgi:putative DNA primase/helicase
MSPSDFHDTCSHSAKDVKQEAAGRWQEILPTAGLPYDLLDGRGHPCPNCGGTDRFSAFPDFEQTGGVICRHCFKEKNGDGLAAVQWIRDCTFPEAVAWTARYLGLESPSKPSQPDIVAEVARAKRMPLGSFLKFGAAATTRGRKRVARVPVYDEKGEIHSYFDLTPKDKGRFKHGKGSSGLFFPGRLPQDGEIWLIVEGVKDAAALIGLGYNAVGLPQSEMAAKFARLFAGCDVVIVSDLDVPGTRGANRTAGRLAELATSVRMARLPGEIVPTGGDDVRDVIARSGEQSVRDSIELATDWQPTNTVAGDERPLVILTDDEASVAEEVLKHLADFVWDTSAASHESNERFRIYQRGDELFQIVCDDSPFKSGITLPEAAPRIRPLPRALVRERITQAVRLVKEELRKEGESILVPKTPPEWLVLAIHQRGQFTGVRRLAGIVRTPTLRPDGTVFQERGYDPETGLVLHPDCSFAEVPNEPTRDEAITAVQELVEIVADFPFESEAHRSIWLGATLTMLARPAVNGPCPLFAFDANTRGAGKSLLADVASILATGRPMARTAWAGNDKETQKSITAIALEAWPAVLFDNVATVLGSPSFEAALTGTTWQGRILGESRTTGLLPLTTVWLASGNNLQLSGDMARRTLMCRLESLEEHPEDRKDIRHPDLKSYVRRERARLAVCGLTILRGYFAAGCPDMGIPAWGSFEAWSNLIRQALVWAGQADPWQTRDAMRDVDQSAEIIRLLHAGIEQADVEGSGVTSADIARLLDSPVSEDKIDAWSTLRVAIEELCDGRKITSQRIGCGLRKFKGRVSGGKRLNSRPGHGGVKLWFIEAVEKVPTGGDGGDGGDEINHSGKKSEEHSYVF